MGQSIFSMDPELGSSDLTFQTVSKHRRATSTDQDGAWLIIVNVTNFCIERLNKVEGMEGE